MSFFEQEKKKHEKVPVTFGTESLQRLIKWKLNPLKTYTQTSLKAGENVNLIIKPGVNDVMPPLNLPQEDR